MSAAEVIKQIEELPSQEQEKIFTFLAEKVMSSRGGDTRRWLGKKLSFQEACDVVFRENRELLSLLAK
jgi:hypothetical protein